MILTAGQTGACQWPPLALPAQASLSFDSPPETEVICKPEHSNIDSNNGQYYNSLKPNSNIAI